jgi:hypothetical protein
VSEALVSTELSSSCCWGSSQTPPALLEKNPCTTEHYLEVIFNDHIPILIIFRLKLKLKIIFENNQLQRMSNYGNNTPTLGFCPLIEVYRYKKAGLSKFQGDIEMAGRCLL